jgi:predicted PurR-regulated permease PerM
MSGLSSLASGLVSSIGAALTSTFGLIVSCLVIFFVGLFLAVGPSKSRDGVVVLAAPPYRHETRRVLDKLGHQLWRWLIGRFASMLVTGVGVGVSLGLLGVPMALSLGVATGILTFVPNIGAAIALSLAVLMALPMGMMTVLWVVVIYLAFQLLESYALTPLIQQYQVSIPPALLIGAQAVLGALLGFAGAMIASPVVVVMSVLVHDVYRKHWLGETL